MPCVKNHCVHNIPGSSTFPSSAVEKNQRLCAATHPPLLPRRTQERTALPGRQCSALVQALHQNNITAVLILSVSNRGRSLRKLKSSLSDDVSEETQFILIQDISCHSELTVHKELRYSANSTAGDVP